MKTETKAIGALALLAGLGGLFFYTQSESKAEKDSRSQTATKDLPAVSLNPEDVTKVTRLEFKPSGKDKDGKEKETIVLEKKGDGWEVTAPFAAKAATADVTALLEALKSLKITDTIDRGTGAYDQYDVADGKGTSFTAYIGGTKAIELVFGSSGSRGQMVRVIGKDGVYVADGYPSTHMTKDAKGWRDKSIFKFEDANVASVKLENAFGSYSFTKNGDNWSGTYVKSATAPAPEKKDDEEKKDADAKKDGEKKDDAKKDGEKKDDAKKDGADAKKPDASGFVAFDGKTVENMLRAFKGLNATDFGGKDDDTGLAAAATEGGVITITLKDGAGEFKLHVGKKQKGSNRFAKKDGDETVFVVSSWAGDWAVAEPKKFEKKDEKDEKKDPHGGHGMPEGMDLDLEGLE